MKTLRFFTVVILVAALASCKKESEHYNAVPLADYFPLTQGKYLTYKLDSTVYLNLGSVKEIHSYQVKFNNEGPIADNLGRQGMRIVRYIRKDSSAAWQPDHTYVGINTGNAIEWIENNDRIIKLVQPIKEGYEWKGNRYTDMSLNNRLLNFQNWKFTYRNVFQLAQIGRFSFDSTINVLHQDIGDTSNPNNFYLYIHSEETYAKGVGLVYKNLDARSWQSATRQFDTEISYGIKMTLIDKN